jgi:hypothetical protein
MENSMKSAQVLEQLTALKNVLWQQDFTFTPAQQAQYNQLLATRRAQVNSYIGAR